MHSTQVFHFSRRCELHATAAPNKLVPGPRLWFAVPQSTAPFEGSRYFSEKIRMQALKEHFPPRSLLFQVGMLLASRLQGASEGDKWCLVAAAAMPMPPPSLPAVMVSRRGFFYVHE
ncbi:uncharacterized protein VTP21DRAFT_7553 [Calcarisporiella thermophila]|uniref:uncharacterized protein n=1 Tax=Calcarisporiella thermophila TaxID=911321 RepID=UPI003744678D